MVGLAGAASAVVVGATVAGYRFTPPTFLLAMAGCGAVFVLGLRAGRVARPLPEPLDGHWHEVHIDAPRAADLAAAPHGGHSTAA